jgi:hypothetical protein
LPATVLLARRFLEAERDVQRVEYAANFDCGSAISVAGVPLNGDFTLTIEESGSNHSPAEVVVIPVAQRSELRAPVRAAFFTLRRNDEVLVRGATQFADARQGDFRAAESFVNEVRSERKSALERNTTPDPFVTWWLVLLAGAVLWSWWPGKSAGSISTAESVRRKPAIP